MLLSFCMMGVLMGTLIRTAVAAGYKAIAAISGTVDVYSPKVLRATAGMVFEIPVVIDGFISAVAALCAFRLCPASRDYMIPSHASYELGYPKAMDEPGLRPFLLLDMRLGEGSGCPLAFLTVEAACTVMNDMATFAEAAIDDGYLKEIREGDAFSVKRSET